MGEGVVREFGIDMSTLLYLKWVTNKDNQQANLGIAQGTLLNVTWQPGWERGLEENGYMYMDGSVPSLFTGNCHDIVNWLYPIKK